MFVGHLAVALAAKRAQPHLPLGTAVAAAFGLDLLWPLLLLAGVETVSIHAGDTAFTHLRFDSYPWSHSLLLVSLWSTLAAVLGGVVLRSWVAAAMIEALVMSHWVLDFITHRPDLPLWPGGPVVGLGLWNSIPATVVVEGGMLAAGLWAYTRGTTARDAVGRWALAGLVALTTGIWITQPWSPPPPDPRAVAWGGLVLFLLPFWASWIDRHRTPSVGPKAT